MENFEKQSGDSINCYRCGKKIKNTTDHIRNCKKAVEYIDYIKCKICNKKFAVLYTHCKIHGIDSKQYEDKYGQLMCSEALKRITARNNEIENKNRFQTRMKREGRFEELEAHNKKMAKKVSDTVLANSELRKKRSECRIKINKSQENRTRASLVAKRTSARKDIQEKRARVLKDWREKNPEKFAEITKSMHKFQSKPEKELFEIISKKYQDFFFKRNQQINRKNVFITNKSGIKQIDIFSKQKKIIIEYDGPLHFKNVKRWNQLESVSLRDKELNSLLNEFLIIRIGHDQFSYRQSDYGFKESCIAMIDKILTNEKSGLFLIGDCYAEDKIS